MHEQNKISVVMPSYNQGRFIAEAIDSVLEQEGVDVELIVMDGGSDDETIDVLKSYGDALVFTSGPDDGQSWAINEGMRRTTGDIVCWLNSDDRFLPDALRIVDETFGADPDLEFLAGGGLNIAEDGSPIGDVGARPSQLWELIHHRNSFSQPSCFMRRGLWFDLDGLNEDLDYVMDWDLWIRCGCAKGMFVTDLLSENRSYADNKTNSGGQRRLDEIAEMLERHAGSTDAPVLPLYELETKLKDPGLDQPEREQLGRQLMEGMAQRLSGVAPNGAFGRRFCTSASPRTPEQELELRFVSVARYVESFRSQRPVAMQWTASNGESGEFILRTTEETQRLPIPTVKFGEVVTVDFTCVGQGYTPIAGTEILGYLDGMAGAT